MIFSVIIKPQYNVKTDKKNETLGTNIVKDLLIISFDATAAKLCQYFI